MSKTLENGFDKVSQEVSQAAEDVKETMNEVGGWWKKSTTEEKVTTILGIILLIRGLWRLRAFIRGVVLLLLGGLLVSGYFNKWLKPLFSSVKKPAKSVEKSEPTKTPTKKPAKK